VPFFFGQILTLLPLHIFYTIHLFLTDDRSCTLKFFGDGDKQNMILSPCVLVKVLKDDLENYVQELRNTDNTKLRENFEKRFDFDHVVYL
jgi:hypothetical protein